MKIRFLFLTLFFTFCFSSIGQEDPFQQDIIEYLNNNGTRDQYSGAFESMFDVLKQQFSASEVPQSVWKELQNDKEKSLDEIVNLLTFAYRNHFTHDEINTMNEFFSTDAGKQMLKDPSQLSTAQNDEISTFFKSDIGIKIEEKKPELSKDIMEISEHWSRDLFAAKMKNLIELGYSTGH
ncbi:MAG: DUF2059 domain-containing protein [Bacteroidia bacterium]|nr:DUF2059 domain-containing protein [Bacteroidia bacterium]NNF32268.1 DUF2059 domain-containing protein [Flavobacteriaceae bacterium]MBT8276910.1 DUF2059 domain-containing protein [Bacteroidia bacterium]NNJ82898.1 DUF2059 domain-containing protein [Flavobacteriaceae bacterium]NNK53773.1 DUF2059 domain-containing protein [Flavobacteriaceae bacterium]